MIYKDLKIEATSINGFQESVEAMRLPKNSESDSYFVEKAFVLGDGDKKLAGRLIKAGNDHAKAMRGIIVWATHTAMVGWILEFQTYRHGVEWLSTSSSMHGELKELKGYELAEKKQKDLPEKLYTTSYHLSYQALRSIYFARRKHRHPAWRQYCQWIESLPYFDCLIAPGILKNSLVQLY